MRIGIAYSSDRGFLEKYIYDIIKNYSEHIKVVILTKGSVIQKKSFLKSLNYISALFIILGFKETFNRSMGIIKRKFNKRNIVKELCEQKNIPYFEVSTVNSREAIEILKKFDLDLLFNQSQHIVKKKVLEIPRLAVINRHGALLPKYRGRLAPFWQLKNKEKYSGLTYHVLDENIDNGPIILQEKIPIEKDDNVVSLVNKMFDLAIKKFGKVIQFYSKDDYAKNYIKNDSSEATYYTSPTLKDAINFKLRK